MPGDVRVQSRRRRLMPKLFAKICRIIEFQVGSCLYVTAAVKGGSLRASRTWSQRPKLVQGSLEPVEGLAPPPPPSLPFLSLLSGVFLYGILRITTFLLRCVPGRLFVAGNTFLSLLSLSLSFLLSFLSSPSSLGVPGCFRHSWEPFLFGVSLDACVVAGSTFVSFFLSLSFPPPLPPLSSCVAYLQAN